MSRLKIHVERERTVLLALTLAQCERVSSPSSSPGTRNGNRILLSLRVSDASVW
jgi:hypothetical protein